MLLTLNVVSFDAKEYSCAFISVLHLGMEAKAGIFCVPSIAVLAWNL